MRALVVIVAALLASAVPVRAAPVSADKAMARVCGAGGVPLEVLGSRHFVTIGVDGPKGRAALRMHVDSGGSTFGLYVQRAALQRLGVADGASLPRAIWLGARKLELPPDVEWYVSDHPDPRGERIADGQIGARLLAQYLVCIDPEHGRFGLLPPDAITIDAAGSLPMRLVGAGQPMRAMYPFVEAEVGGERFALLFDTGATSSMLERAVLQKLHAAHPTWPLVHGAAGDADMLGGHMLEDLLRVPSVRVAGRDLGPALFVERPDGTWPGMFGVDDARGALANDVLDRYRILLDYGHRRLWLLPSRRPPDRSASMTRVAVSVAFGADGCPVVKSSATDALRAGDVILAVDGADACTALHYKLSTALAGAAGTKKTLRLRRDGKTLTVAAPVRDLLSP